MLDHHKTKGQACSGCTTQHRREVGRVTPAERDEIRAMFERKNGLAELFRSLITASKEDLDRSHLYERVVKDMGETSSSFQKWWNDKSKHYNWENLPNHRWEIDFDTCAIYVVES